MTAADIRLPRRAEQDLLGDFMRRLRRAERRAAWPSVVNVASEVIDQNGYTTVQNIAAGGYPTAGMTEAVSLTLDPGRWILIGDVFHEIIVITGSKAEAGVVIGFDDGVESDQRIMKMAGTNTTYMRLYRPNRVALEVRADNEITATLSVFAGAAAGASFTNYYLARAQILAFPA